MEVINLHLDRLSEAPWNPNTMVPAMREKLRNSIASYGLVENLVVRATADKFEVLSGNQRLGIYRDLCIDTVPCVVVDLDDTQARLLAQVLNRTRGDDNQGLKAELVRQVMEDIPQSELVALLPETVESLNALAALGQETMAEHLDAWERARGAKLHTLQLRLTQDQLNVVHQALSKALPKAKERPNHNPNARGNALFIICSSFLEHEEEL